ncbi:phosphotransferase [Streptomyces sp. NPDC101490]|uniref:phosphotransferase family protein n=1 Tax=Streptomyces sp. NPDC101490 TaxID=3366143 RepID=UPI00380D2C82
MDPTAPPRAHDHPAPPLPERLASVAHAVAHRSGAPCSCPSGLVGVLADRDDGTVVRHGDLVAKAHAPGTDPDAHRARLALAAHPDVSDVLLPPLPGGPGELDGRPVSLWPYGPPVDPADPDAAPWEAAARLLARLHRTPPPGGAARLPESRAPLKAALAVGRMRATAPDHPGTATVLAAWRTIPGVRSARDGGTAPGRREALGIPRTSDAPDAPGLPHSPDLPRTSDAPDAPGLPHSPDLPQSPGLPHSPNSSASPDSPEGHSLPEGHCLQAGHGLPESHGPRLLCHGDFHLGQLVRDVRSESAGPWRLIDVDDLGLGDPAWDLARPAAWFAAGVLPPEVWSRFLGAYQEAGGPAVGADPWARLDLPARALTVQTAALALAKSTVRGRPLDEVEDVMIDTCARIAGFRTASPSGASA